MRGKYNRHFFQQCIISTCVLLYICSPPLRVTDTCSWCRFDMYTRDIYFWLMWSKSIIKGKGFHWNATRISATTMKWKPLWEKEVCMYDDVESHGCQKDDRHKATLLAALCIHRCQLAEWFTRCQTFLCKWAWFTMATLRFTGGA